LSQFGQQQFAGGRPLLDQTNAAVSDEISNLGALNDPITIDSITANPAFGAVKGAVESQFANARRSTIADSPEGGALQGNLGTLEGQRAATLAQAFGGLAATENDRRLQNLSARTGVLGAAGQLGLGQTAQAGAALGAGGGVLGQLGANQAAIAQANIARDSNDKATQKDFQARNMEAASDAAGGMAGGK
jgi:hypothetical protein